MLKCQVSPNELLNKAFSFRGLSRNTISSLALAAEVEVKAGGFANSGGGNNAAGAATDVGGVDGIRAASDNLTHQQVGIFICLYRSKVC